jgi:ProP effector
MNTVSPSPSPIASARALLKELQEQYVVFRECRPLAIGVDKQLLAARPELDRKLLRLALRTHTASVRYLKAVEKGSQRFDLDGNPVAELSEEHRTHAAETLRERFRKDAEQRRAKDVAEKAAKQAEQAEQRRAEKLSQLAAKFAKR